MFVRSNSGGKIGRKKTEEKNIMRRKSGKNPSSAGYTVCTEPMKKKGKYLFTLFVQRSTCLPAHKVYGRIDGTMKNHEI